MLFLLCTAFILLILFPGSVYAGVCDGLKLWFQILVPTLFPFLLVTGLMEQYIPLAKPKLYLLFTGLLSGYPVGAKSCCHALSQNAITQKEGQFFLSFINNASPAFLLNFVFVQNMHLGTTRFLLFFILLLSSFLGSFVYSKIYDILHFQNTVSAVYPANSTQNTLHRSIDSLLLSIAEILVKIGGYVMIFSLFARTIQNITILPNTVKLLLCGCLEITTGSSLLAGYTKLYASQYLPAMFFLAFGGFSAFFQTKSVIKNSKLSSTGYLISKILSGCFSTILTSILLLMDIL